MFSTLTDDRFLEDFFEDPDSAQLMTTPTVLLITSMSWGFTEALLVSHLEWFFGILEADDELLSAVAFEHPDIILAAVLNEPALASYVTTARWSAHLRLGFDHATPSEKVGNAAAVRCSAADDRSCRCLSSVAPTTSGVRSVAPPLTGEVVERHRPTQPGPAWPR